MCEEGTPAYKRLFLNGINFFKKTSKSYFYSKTIAIFAAFLNKYSF